ncbi:MAG TPA: hypothetical protein DCE42_29445 [Myxococcales bacterium]|nr:hypothetical protein [Myxococcales bacterium]
MNCPRCGYQNREGRSNCSLCHTPLQGGLTNSTEHTMEHHQNTLPPQKTTVPGMLPAGQTPQDFDVDDDEQTLNRSSRFHTNPDEETIQGGSKKFTPKRTVVQPNRPLSYQETESVGGEWTGLPTNQDADDETTLVSTSSSRIQAVVPPQASTPETVETPSYQSLPQALPHIPEVDEKKTVPQGRDIMSGLQQNQPAPSAAQTVATPKPVMPAAEGGSIDNKTDPTGAPMEAAFNMSAPLGATTQQQTSATSPLPRPKLSDGFVFAPKARIPALWRRAVAGCIDFGLLSVLAFFVTLMFGPSRSKPFPQDLQGLDFLATFISRYTAHIFFFFIAYAVVYSIYATLGHKLIGATLGKVLFGLRVIDRNGQPLSWIASVSRSLAHVLFFFLALIGVTWIFDDRNYRGIHDRIAGSIVVNK